MEQRDHKKSNMSDDIFTPLFRLEEEGDWEEFKKRGRELSYKLFDEVFAWFGEDSEYESKKDKFYRKYFSWAEELEDNTLNFKNEYYRLKTMAANLPPGHGRFAIIYAGI